MATDTLVEGYVEDGQKLVTALKADGFDVTAAFWVKTNEDQLWLLYIASSDVGSKPLFAAYRDVYGVLRRLPSLWVSESVIKLIGSSNPIAADVVRLRNNWPGRTVVRKLDLQIGSMHVDELIIYPDL